jgi:hypothetical protein
MDNLETTLNTGRRIKINKPKAQNYKDEQHGPSLKKEDGVRGRGRIGSSRF